MTTDRLALLQQWHAVQAQLRQLEAYERELRCEVVKQYMGDYGDGSRSVDVGNGYTLKNINTTRYDVKDTPQLRQLVQNFVGYPETADAGAALLKDKPRMSLTAFKALPQWGRNMMTPHVTATPQLPQLSIIPPKV